MTWFFVVEITEDLEEVGAGEGLEGLELLDFVIVDGAGLGEGYRMSLFMVSRRTSFSLGRMSYLF